MPFSRKFVNLRITTTTLASKTPYFAWLTRHFWSKKLLRAHKTLTTHQKSAIKPKKDKKKNSALDLSAVFKLTSTFDGG